MFFAVFAALTSGLAFTGLQIILKHHARPETSPLALPAYMGLLAPIWITLLFVTQSNHLLSFNFEPTALAYPIGWAICTVSTTCLLTWLLGQFSLTEVTGYKKALITLGALMADIFVFNITFQLLKLAAIGFLLFAALTLSKTRNRTPTLNEFFILLLWCTLLTLQITLYRMGQLHQPEVFSLTILAQTAATIIYAFLWTLPSVYAGPKFSLPGIFGVLTCAFVGVSLEGFAYAELPLSVVMLLTILPATLFAAHDLYRKDLTFTAPTARALAALAAGILMLFLAR